MEDYEIQAVTLVPEGGEGTRNAFSAVLEVDLSSGQVGLSRKEGVRSITIPVEQKDISVVAQLAGRPLAISHWVDESLQVRDELVRQVRELEQEKEVLLQRLGEMKQQVHFLVEGSRA